MVVVNKNKTQKTKQDDETIISFPNGTVPSESFKRTFTLILSSITLRQKCSKVASHNSNVISRKS